MSIDLLKMHHLVRQYADPFDVAPEDHDLVVAIGTDTPMPFGKFPAVEGLYAVEIHFGWKLLEWYAGAWWHMARIGRWMADDPVQWVGPLPERTLIKGKKGEPPTEKMEFDL